MIIKSHNRRPHLESQHMQAPGTVPGKSCKQKKYIYIYYIYVYVYIHKTPVNFTFSVFLCSVHASLPSGKRLHGHGNNNFYWENSLFLWAMFQYVSDSIDVNLENHRGFTHQCAMALNVQWGAQRLNPQNFPFNHQSLPFSQIYISVFSR